MVKPSNCSLEGGSFPLSSEFLQVIKKDLWIFLVPVVVGLVQLALFLEEMGFFLRNIKSSRRTCLYLWILGVYPIFCIASIIGMFIPRSSGICNFVASIYHSITLWKFLELITDFFGGKAQMLEVLGGHTVSPNPPPCCCCCCFPNIQVNRNNLRWMNIAVYQLSVVRTLLFFVGLILWTDEKYDYGDLDYTNPNSYINIIIGLSTFLSFYGYLLFYKATKKALEGYSPRSKFICITLVLVLCGLQNGILETMGALGAIPCVPPWTVETRSQTIYNYSITLEMFFISLFARYCFCRVEPSHEAESLIPEVVKNKSSQTTLADMYSLSEDEGVAINSAYISEGDETLCHIEHAPLDKYDFLQENRTVPMQNYTVRSPTQSSGMELGNMNMPQAGDVSDGAKAPVSGKNRLQVQAQINYIDDATVV
ncbi:PREDICTED: organic solute transporter subunit alpha-like [Nanorana parkeri]|uniref:organic solute transporter subunit alpha-like n=1 Tax=Nanorana parkeri TaxID=125878 RepID=UPI000854B5EF|nr:PREDICTED: organic solute transporter subunit alpha-like [Nanorana parkeri]